MAATTNPKWLQRVLFFIFLSCYQVHTRTFHIVQFWPRLLMKQFVGIGVAEWWQSCRTRWWTSVKKKKKNKTLLNSHTFWLFFWKQPYLTLQWSQTARILRRGIDLNSNLNHHALKNHNSVQVVTLHVRVARTYNFKMARKLFHLLSYNTHL